MQFDFDGELGLLHGKCGSMDAEPEVQRTIKRAELTAFPLPFQESFFLQSRCMSTTKELQMGYGEEKGNVSIQKLAVLFCGSKIWKKMHLLTSE